MADGNEFGANTDRIVLTELLNRMGQGDRKAGSRAVPLIYEELHQIAARAMRSERPGHTLQTTALIHEAYLRLVDDDKFKVENRGHFYALASIQMRKVLVEHARARNAARRGGGAVHESIHRIEIGAEGRSIDLLLLDESLEELERLDPRAAKVVELKYFGGLSDEEAADALLITPRMVRRDWEHARGWLLTRMHKGGAS
jgi:RNA polymerase sigma-70 factor (ECF subfamily)